MKFEIRDEIENVLQETVHCTLIDDVDSSDIYSSSFANDTERGGYHLHRKSFGRETDALPRERRASIVTRSGSPPRKGKQRQAGEEDGG